MRRATIADVMTTDVVTIGPGTSFNDIVRLLTQRKISTLKAHLGRESLIPIAHRLAWAVEGVMRVVDELTFNHDDTTLKVERHRD